MNTLFSKVPVLAVVSLVTGAMTMLVGQWPSRAAKPVPYEAKAQTAPELVTLRIAAKDRVARDVVAGKFSLYEAAALFGALNQVSPRSTDLALMPVSEDSLGVPGGSELERLCTQVIRYVRWQLAEEPEQAEAAVARLKADFEENLRKMASTRLASPWSLVSVQELLQQARAELTEKGVISRKG